MTLGAQSVKAERRKTAQLGEVVAAAFDRAARYSADPRKVSRLVTRAVALMLCTQRVRMTSSRWPSFIVPARP